LEEPVEFFEFVVAVDQGYKQISFAMIIKIGDMICGDRGRIEWGSAVLVEQQRLGDTVGEPLFVTIHLIYDGSVAVAVKTLLVLDEVCVTLA
jgi:hypothetical protein